MKILTFDIEEWYQEKVYFGNHKERYLEYDKYLDRILEALDKRGIKATFFCLGGMATDFPDVVKKISRNGHEVGCHSFKHTWLNKMNKEELREDTKFAVDALEQCIGKKVISYRAPAFSIGEGNKWAFEILGEMGIRIDASIFPAEREFGGFPRFDAKSPVLVYKERTIMKEFPISTTLLWGHELAYSGGGYFRLFPLSFVRKEMAKSDYCMAYFHIRDLIPETSGVLSREKYESYFKEPGTLKNRYMRHLKTNFGKKNAFNKMVKLIETENFVSIEQSDAMIDWESQPTILI